MTPVSRNKQPWQSSASAENVKKHGTSALPSAACFATGNNQPIGISLCRENIHCNSSKLGSEESALIELVCHRRYRMVRPPRESCSPAKPQPVKLWLQSWQQSMATATSKAATTTSCFATKPCQSCCGSSSTLSRRRLLTSENTYAPNGCKTPVIELSTNKTCMEANATARNTGTVQ